MPAALELAAQLTSNRARVGIVGTGYVGLPLALAFTQRCSVVAYDQNADTIAALEEGKSHLPHIPDDAVARSVRSYRLHPTTDPARLRTCAVLIICVPTPLGKHREPDLSYVRAAAQVVAKAVTPGCLVVLESTTYPGTTEEVLAPLLQEGSGLVPGQDFAVAYAPERENPGVQYRGEVPKVIGGLTPLCGDAAEAVYRLVGPVWRVSCAQTAETTKLLENVFRCVNIALVNEMKLMAERMGIDIWEVIEAASTKPYGFMPFYPGPGLGGHCIPIDPFYLAWRAKGVGAPTRFIELAGEINAAMPEHVTRQVQGKLNERGKALRGSRVLLVGLAYKKGVADCRESPALAIGALLEEQGAKVLVHDPVVAPTGAWRHVEWLDDLRHARNVDAVCIVTDHDCIDWDALRAHPCVVDTRDVLRRTHPSAAAGAA